MRAEQMNEKDIKRLCFILVIGGIGIILIANKVAITEEMNIEDVNEEMVGEYVKICGNIERISVNDNGAFLNLKNISSMDIVFFQDYVKALNINSFKQNEKVCVEGRVEYFDNKLEIVGKKIYY